MPRGVLKSTSKPRRETNSPSSARAHARKKRIESEKGKNASLREIIDFCAIQTPCLLVRRRSCFVKDVGHHPSQDSGGDETAGGGEEKEKVGEAQEPQSSSTPPYAEEGV